MLDQWGCELYKDGREVLEEEGVGAEWVENAGCEYWVLLFYGAEVDGEGKDTRRLTSWKQVFTIVATAIVAVCVLFLSTNAAQQR